MMSIRTLLVGLVVAGTCSLTVSASADSAKAYSFRGVEPGRTTVKELQANKRWGEPKKKEAGEEGAERWHYRPRGYREAVVTVRADRVQTLDIYMPRNVTIEDAAAALKLGIPLEAESLTSAAKMGVEIPSAWEAIPYSAGRVVLYADPKSDQAMLVRSYAADILGLPDADPAPGSAPAIADNSSDDFNPSLAKRSAIRGQDRANREIVASVAKILPHYHVSRHPLDDQIAERALNLQLENLDSSRLYFSHQDIVRFRRQVDQYDDRLRQGDLGLAYDVFRTFLKRFGERMQLVDQLLENDFDFSVDEELILRSRKEPWPENDLELRETCRKWIKYRLLTHLEAGSDLEEAKRKFVRSLRNNADQQALVDDADLMSTALSAVFAAYDPRSNYYSPRQWEDSQLSIASEMVGIGASLKVIDGYVEVVRIVTGSPSHLDGRLQQGDRIVAVGQGNDGKMVEITGMKLADTVQLIRGAEGTVARLRVLPKEGFEATFIDITRAKFEMLKIGSTIFGSKEHGRSDSVHSGSVRSNSARIGFIHLPTIYTDMAARSAGKADYRSTTRDMRPVLENLKKQDVDVLVLDLRNNPGGSLVESMNVAGLFTGPGTVLQVRDGAGRVETYNAELEKADVVWDRPLVIITNKGSSGGPEIISAAVQDYRRGIVIGDSTTNGNGAVANQKFITELMGISAGENGEPADAKPTRMGIARLVIQKFYRVNGDGFQGRGITPEVILPSISDVWYETQADLPYALTFDQIKPAQFTAASSPVGSDDMERIKKWSSSRLSKSAYFQKIQPRIAELRERRGKHIFPLNREKYREERRKNLEQFEEAPALADIPDVRINSYLKECMAVALDYAGEYHLAAAEKALKEHHYEKALRGYRRAVASNPLRKQSRYKLAWALSTLPSSQYRDGKQAVQHARKLCEMDGRKSWSYLLTLAIAEAEAGDFEKAKEELAAALEKAPEKHRTQYDYLKSRFENRRTYAQ